MTVHEPPGPAPRTSVAEVFWCFLRLGLTSFGGPIAHLGYFRDAFVVRRQWLNEPAYAELVALCQFLPGPASSQVGYGIGWLRAGPLGAVAAWVAFTLPSAILMVAFAFGAAALRGPLASGVLQGLKLVAVMIVAQAVFGMAKTLTPDLRRAAIALGALLAVSLFPASVVQIAVIALGAGLGLALCQKAAPTAPHALMRTISPRTGLLAMAVFFILLLGGPLVATAAPNSGFALFDAFYRSGALVFGGGHVVLPLLHEAVVEPGWVDPETFLAGYGAAQALPGPLFTFSAFLGAVVRGHPDGMGGALIALIALSLPGLLALTAALPFWERLRRGQSAQAAMAGANAAVVGILAAALYDPIWTSAVHDRLDFAAVAVGFGLLTVARTPPIIVVLLGAAYGAMMIRSGIVSA